MKAVCYCCSLLIMADKTRVAYWPEQSQLESLPGSENWGLKTLIRELMAWHSQGLVMGWELGRGRVGVAISVSEWRNLAYRKQNNTEAKSSRAQKLNGLRKTGYSWIQWFVNIQFLFSRNSCLGPPLEWETFAYFLQNPSLYFSVISLRGFLD